MLNARNALPRFRRAIPNDRHAEMHTQYEIFRHKGMPKRKAWHCFTRYAKGTFRGLIGRSARTSDALTFARQKRRILRETPCKHNF
ncbi:hypothetical protein BGL_1c02030 [Burkholderia plantarii]|uniref:Uncharacterized protein n=1 Tax=Burkholderia plantarii TaxID=41899 RepID=A0A0B6RUL1_BURPL|nr:hypothetical protein BGL_1c02030 [Burkholderia plantarii]